MTEAKQIEAGSTVYTVGPSGEPNAHTARIGSGRVVELYSETVNGTPTPYAHVEFFDGKAGGWPVEQLRSQP
jgi:hypothetical protein